MQSVTQYLNQCSLCERCFSTRNPERLRHKQINTKGITASRSSSGPNMFSSGSTVNSTALLSCKVFSESCFKSKNKHAAVDWHVNKKHQSPSDLQLCRRNTFPLILLQQTLCFVKICVTRTINGYCNTKSCLCQCLFCCNIHTVIWCYRIFFLHVGWCVLVYVHTGVQYVCVGLFVFLPFKRERDFTITDLWVQMGSSGVLVNST